LFRRTLTFPRCARARNPFDRFAVEPSGAARRSAAGLRLSRKRERGLAALSSATTFALHLARC